jgi:hypothetical protein
MAQTTNEFKRKFLSSEEAITIREQLIIMMSDPHYNTRSTYTPLQVEDMTFVDKHIAYISEHPKLNPTEYMANLRLKTKLRNL